MEGDVIIGLLMVIFWVISSLAARFGRAVKGHTQARESSQSEARTAEGKTENPFQRALRELAEQMNVEVEVVPEPPPVPSEQPVASEHDHTPGWHDRTASETRPTASEHEHTPGWHDRTASEAARTASETRLAPSEHRMTDLEHRRGDLQGARIPRIGGVQRRRESELSRRLRADLTGGPKSLARAVLLSEILGPPVSLRPAGRERA